MAPVKEIIHNFELGCANFQLITLLHRKHVSGEKKCPSLDIFLPVKIHFPLNIKEYIFL